MVIIFVNILAFLNFVLQKGQQPVRVVCPDAVQAFAAPDADAVESPYIENPPPSWAVVNTPTIGKACSVFFHPGYRTIGECFPNQRDGSELDNEPVSAVAHRQRREGKCYQSDCRSCDEVGLPGYRLTGQKGVHNQEKPNDKRHPKIPFAVLGIFVAHGRRHTISPGEPAPTGFRRSVGNFRMDGTRRFQNSLPQFFHQFGVLF